MTKVFSEPCGDSILYVTQITQENLELALEAKSRISEESWELYVSGSPEFDAVYRVVKRRPLEPNGTGNTFFIMVLNDEVVGLSNHNYYTPDYGGDFRCVIGGLVILDEHQRKGIGTAYSHISVRIARYMGAKFFLGETRLNSPMHLLRKRQGWQEKGTFERGGEDWVKIQFTL